MDKTKNDNTRIPPSEMEEFMSYSETMERLLEMAKSRDGSVNKLATEIGVAQNTLDNILNNRGKKGTGRVIFKVFEHYGIKLQWPGAVRQTERPVTFALEHGGISPKSEDYRAIPLVSSRWAATPEAVPKEAIESWCMLWRHIPALLGRKNLIAYEIKRDQRSMEPVLHPGDFIAIDRDDRTLTDSSKGNTFMVLAPDGTIQIKRVRVQSARGHNLLVCYSENPEFPPDVYDLAAEYGGEISNAIIGRVVYSWASMLSK